MNHGFIDFQTRERVNQALDEGTRNQAYHRAAYRKATLSRVLPRLIVVILVISGILNLLGR
jgi:hypothetical protein